MTVSILYVEDNRGDSTLMNEAFRDLGFDPKNTIWVPTLEAAVHFLDVRYYEGGVPPPHTIVFSLSPHHHHPDLLLNYLNEHKLLSKIPVIVFGSSFVPANDKMNGLLAQDKVYRRPYPNEWSQVMDSARAIIDVAIQNEKDIAS